MNNRDKYIKQINRSLNLLRLEIETLNKVNLMDYNIIAEDFYRDLLKFCGYNLKNLNETSKNADSIDLVDIDNKIAIQVTSRNDTTKIHDTIKGFYNNSEYDKYKRLIILLVGKPKLDYSRTDFTQGNLFPFDKQNDIIDIADIIKKFKGYGPKELETIVDFLEKEVDIKINIKKSKSNEVITIIKMIEYLSDDSNYKEVDTPELVDPDKKRQRFEKHFVYLMQQYINLYAIYSGALSEAKNTAGNDGVRAKKISLYLKDISDNFLTKHDNNPQEAINALTEFFESEISSINTSYNRQSIKFYLLDELIQCNVFPNPIG